MSQEDWPPAGFTPSAGQPPSSPPPQMPLPPAVNPTPIPSPPADLAAHYIKPRRHWLLAASVAIVALAVLAGAVLFVLRYENNPATIFNQALRKSLSTKQLTETINSDTSASTVELDVVSPRAPRLSTLTTKSLGTPTYAKGYGTLQNTYIDYASDPTAKTVTPPTLLDQWIQLRQNGTLPQGFVMSQLFATSDPRLQLLQPWLFGNFSSKDRGALLHTIATSGLYHYVEPPQQKTGANGQPDFVYTLKVNGTKLAAYEAQAGALYGIPASDIASTTDRLKNTTLDLAVYIQKSNKQIVRVDVTQNGATTHLAFSSYNTTKLPDEPSAKLSFSAYLKQLGS